MKNPIWFVLLAGLASAACEEEKPQSPPTIGEITVECGQPRRAGEYPEIASFTVAISDPERDLVASSIKGVVNGIPMTGFADPDADEKFSWTPPAETEPPMVCRGEFTIVVEAADLGGRSATKTANVSP